MSHSAKSIRVRVLKASDAAAYQEIRLFGLKESPSAFGSSYEESKKLPLETHQKRLGRDHTHEVAVGAFVGPALVGVGGLVRIERIKEAHKAWIVGIYVRPEFRGSGLAKKIMQMLLDKARAIKGLRRVNLIATASNLPAKRLYESFGFKTFGVEPKGICVDGQFYDWEHMGIDLKNKKKVRLPAGTKAKTS